MRSSLLKISAILAALAAMLLISAPANAEQFKSQANCDSWNPQSQTARLTAFAGHHVDVSARRCTNGTWVKWVSQPNISFPSRLNPAAPLESLSVTQQPFIYSTESCYSGKTCRVTYRFTVKQSVFAIPAPSEFVFYYRVYPASSQLCMGSGYDACVTTSWN